MSGQESLFPDIAPERGPHMPPMTVEQKRAARQQLDLDSGIHPVMRTPLDPDPMRLCGNCKHLTRQGGTAKGYLKCGIGPQSRGPATDIRAKWRACMKWIADPAKAALMGGHARTRRADPDTSQEAAASVGELRDSQKQVLGLFDRPMTDEQLIARALRAGVKQSPSGLRSRRSELVHLGYLTDSGERDRTTAGRATTIWRRA